MLITDLDNQRRTWKATGNARKICSEFHLQAKTLLQTRFPTDKILEETPIPISTGKTLFLDFYLPLRKLAVEVHGQQHYEFIPYFHHTKMGFLQGQSRDREKKLWCEINGIELIVLPYDQMNEWKTMIS